MAKRRTARKRPRRAPTKKSASELGKIAMAIGFLLIIANVIEFTSITHRLSTGIITVGILLIALGALYDKGRK